MCDERNTTVSLVVSPSCSDVTRLKYFYLIIDSVSPQWSIKLHISLYDLITAVSTRRALHSQTHLLGGLWCHSFEHGGVTSCHVCLCSPAGSRGHLTSGAKGCGICHVYAPPCHRRYSCMTKLSLSLLLSLCLSNMHVHTSTWSCTHKCIYMFCI